MSIAEKYFTEQMKSGGVQAVIPRRKDKARYRVPPGGVEKGHKGRKSPAELIEKVEDLEKFVMGV